MTPGGGGAATPGGEVGGKKVCLTSPGGEGG